MIDSHAIIEPGARLAPGVTVGPFSIIGADVEIGEGCWIGPHVVLRGPTRIGLENRIYQFASIGEVPQDKKYRGEDTLLEIGNRNVIREGVTINRGTVQGGGLTRIGSDNLIMINAHVAHDCIIGNHTILANNVALAGHVTVDDYAILGGYTLVHQFCALGAHCFTSVASVVTKDVPPFVLVSGHMARPYGLNMEGMKRRGFSAETMRGLRRAYKTMYRSGLSLEQACEALRTMATDCPEIGRIAEFIVRSQRGIVR